MICNICRQHFVDVGVFTLPPNIHLVHKPQYLKKIKLEIRYVESGICPIASPQRPNCSYNIYK